MKQNERHVKARHPDRCKEVEDVWKNKKTCPEESIYQLGTIDELELDEEPSYGGRKYLEKQDYIRMKQKEEIADQQETILMQIDKVNENRLELAKQSRYVRANEEIIQSQECFLFSRKGAGMKLFEAVKEAVTARSAAEYYGIKVGRNGMAVCPFHPDKNPSMKLDKRYHCFACQADGDVIDFVAKYFNLSVKESAEKLAEDFSVPYEKYQSYNKTKDYQKPKQKKQTLDQFFHEQQIRFFRVYSDYFHLLKKWKVEYAPRIEDDDWHPLFVEAMEKYTLIEYKMDVLLSGSLEDRARLILDCQEEVKNIEQRIKEESSGRCGCTSGSVTES